MEQIKGSDVIIGYGGKVVAKDINFIVDKGDYLCIIGENGAGKSTLVKSILGLCKTMAGEITISREIKDDGIGYLPQQTDIQRDFPASVKEVVMSGCLNRCKKKFFFTKKEKDIVAYQLERLGITHLANKSYRALSGGQQQRTLLARALCASDKILILDEPVASLDPKATEDFYRLIDQLNKKDKMTIVMISHDKEAVLNYASHILYLSEQRSFYGTKEEYVSNNQGLSWQGGL